MTQCTETVPDTQPDIGQPTEHQCKKRATKGSQYCAQHKAQHPEGKVIV